ncbi:hypothetical protein [Sinomicrobium sp. M5D2P9]
MPKTKSHFILILSAILFLACKKEHNEADDYEILSAVLNFSYDNESDEANGLYWIDTAKEYHSLLVLNHTNVIEFDLEVIDSYLTFGNFTEFSINDFKKKHKWDLKKIKGFDRYTLETMADQNVKSPYIGMVQISAISYNKNLDRAVVYTSFLCAGNGDCGAGMIFHLKKEEKWIVEEARELWVA